MIFEKKVVPLRGFCLFINYLYEETLHINSFFTH